MYIILVTAFLLPIARGEEKASNGPRVIILGIDGMDHEILTDFIEQGLLPNLAALGSEGTRLPLATSNPVQSCTAWSSIITGLNPGRTGIGGFIRRRFSHSMIVPDLATEESSYDGRSHRIAANRIEWDLGETASNRTGQLLPEFIPATYNRLQGESLWNVLGRNGIRSVVLHAPCSYPVLAHPNADVLGGLGVPDTGRSVGTWYIYSYEPFTFFDMHTNTGGKVIRLSEDNDGMSGRIIGPDNFMLTPSDRKARKQSDEGTKVFLDFSITPDFTRKCLEFKVHGQRQTVKEGSWSSWFPLCFRFSPSVTESALFRFRVIKCAGGEIRLYAPPLNINPMRTPSYLRISSPVGYAGRIAAQLGRPFPTLGWDSATHALKDEEVGEEVFLEAEEFSMLERRALLRDQIVRDDWSLYFDLFPSVDRVQHMLYRLIDPSHPFYRKETAERKVRFLGKEIKMKDAILETYRFMDQVVGEVLRHISRTPDRDTVLMVLSDHGTAPFHKGVALNNLLAEKGFLTTLPGKSGKPMTFMEVVAEDRNFFFQSIDWPKTRAYSLGLGKIYINLEGREPEGVVKQDEYDLVRNEIIAALESYEDPSTGRRVIKKAYKRERIFSGPYWKEGEAMFRFQELDGKTVEVTRPIEGFADLFVGFHRGYRVSWSTSLGGFEEKTIASNSSKWSADHVSVDPSVVPGVFLCNKKVAKGAAPGITDITPTVLRLFSVVSDEELDGTPIPLQYRDR